MPERQFVKYTFLKVDPAWRRLDPDERAVHKREFLAACEDFSQDRLLRAFSLVGTRGDADLLLLSQATNLERIHEFHVVLAQSGLMGWTETPYSYPRDDQAVGVQRRVPARGPPPARQIPVRLPLHQDPRVVRARSEGTLADHAGAHPRGPRVPEHRPQHELLVRARRPGVRRRLRGRRAGGLPRPRPAPAHHRVLAVHQARHAHVHVHRDVGRARPELARRRLGLRSRL